MRFYLALISFGVIFFLLRPVKVIELRSLKSGLPLHTDKVNKGFRFATLINHSVHLSPVYEYYEVGNDWKLYIKETIVQDMGWGVPSGHDMQNYRLESGSLFFSNINRAVPFLPFRISYISEPRLILGREQKEIHLPSYLPNGDRLDIYLKTFPYLLLVWRKNLNVFLRKEHTQYRLKMS